MQADFAVTEKDLDFSHMRDHMRRILAGQSRLFSFGPDNAVVQLVSRGGPRVLESQVSTNTTPGVLAHVNAGRWMSG